MTVTRRQTLALIGGGTILAAGAAGAGFMTTRTPHVALQPWQQAGQYSDPRMRALSYAILAPNPHNRQPWLVDLGREDEVVLYADTDRLLPHTDPFSRQIVIGLGCFLELMAMAAAEDGYGVSFDLFPDGADAARLDGRPVAVARFEQGAVARDPALFAEVLKRRSLKEPFDTARPVAGEVLQALEAAVSKGSVVGSTNDMAQVAALRDLTVRAFEIELNTPRTYHESVELFRIGKREVNASPDGIDFSGPMWDALHMTGMFTREAAMDMQGQSFRSGLEMITGTARTGMAYCWLVTKGNTRAEQIAAGRDWVRLNLAATALGLGVQPMSQALQEFPEMAEPHAQAHERLAPAGGTVQMLGRLGYGPQVPVSPRWPLDAKLQDV